MVLEEVLACFSWHLTSSQAAGPLQDLAYSGMHCGLVLIWKFPPLYTCMRQNQFNNTVTRGKTQVAI